MYTQQPHVIDYSPCLTAEEFGEACHHLDNIYTRTDLGMLRRRWKLNVHNHFDLFGYQSYVSITLPVKLPDQQTGELADALERMNWSEGATQSHGMSIDHDAEMADSENLWNSRSTGLTGIKTPKQATVTYDIIWQPTYGTPRLWFTLNDLPEKYCSTDHDTVYHLLVPEEQKFIRDMGVLGAISLEPHPITFKPAFFIHDCNTSEALTSLAEQRGSRIPLQHYLITWIGLMGHTVGLSIPVRMGLHVASEYKYTELIGTSRDTDSRNFMQFSMLPIMPGHRLPPPVDALSLRSNIGEPGSILVNGYIYKANSLFKTNKRKNDPFEGKWGLKPSDLLLKKDSGSFATGTFTPPTGRFNARSGSMPAAVLGAQRPTSRKRADDEDDGGTTRTRKIVRSIDRDTDNLWTLEEIKAIDIDYHWPNSVINHSEQCISGIGNFHGHPRTTYLTLDAESGESLSFRSRSKRRMHESRESVILNSHVNALENSHGPIVPTQGLSNLNAGLDFKDALLERDTDEEPDSTLIGEELICLRGGCGDEDPVFDKLPTSNQPSRAIHKLILPPLLIPVRYHLENIPIFCGDFPSTVELSDPIFRQAIGKHKKDTDAGTERLLELFTLDRKFKGDTKSRRSLTHESQNKRQKLSNSTHSVASRTDVSHDQPPNTRPCTISTLGSQGVQPLHQPQIMDEFGCLASNEFRHRCSCTNQRSLDIQTRSHMEQWVDPASSEVDTSVSKR